MSGSDERPTDGGLAQDAAIGQAFDPRQTLDVKRDYAAWLLSPMAEQIAQTMAEGYQAQGLSNARDEEFDSLQAAQNFWVAPDMVNVAVTAQKTMPDEDVLLEEPPAPHGFLLLARPFALLCGDPECGEEHPFIGLHWRPAHRTLPANDYAEEQHDDGLILQWFGLAVDEQERAFFGSPVVPVATGTFLPAGRPLASSYSVEIGAMRPMTAELCRYARAMWTLMQQPLAAVGEIEPDRPQRRRLQKSSQVPGPVVIVTLRRRSRPSDPQAEHAQVEWSHRWMVRGHWRNQWHPRLGAHRAIWINEHIKGPDDKPLDLKDKVITWRR
ncbi:hypothetical protein [Amycolatopsis australiensis]|uniref:Uncharacterized protein n=1 Tax=Amycolatopsis australiensis TaxID=546364 RepID=A0A1K1LKM6_9PSEU|nr:hypothetical protein [Amycolatopsis australiensis]SFW11437.1 hypothetical protein SAMN04489730_0016 [Amycolatopsis australiensis]